MGSKLKYYLSEEGLAQIEDMVAQGEPIGTIAKNIGIHPSTLYQWRKQYPQMDRAVTGIPDPSKRAVEKALYQTALSGSVTAQVYWLKNRRKDLWDKEQEAPIKQDLVEGRFDGVPSDDLRGIAGGSTDEEKLLARIELARRHFWDFCMLIAEDFYLKERRYLKEICDEFEAFYQSEDRLLIVNAPPRHGKTRTATLFALWAFGKNQLEKIMVAGYNEMLSERFSKEVRSLIAQNGGEMIVYQDIFPDVALRKGDGAARIWSLENGHNSFLATSPGGTATGFGATLLIVDDLIKNAVEALDEEKLEAQWRWFTDTMLSRLERGGKVIVIMTRWSNGDMAGRLAGSLLGLSARTLMFPAVDGGGSVLCDEIMGAEDLKRIKNMMDDGIYSANYLQKPLSMRGRLYDRFQVYEALPEAFDSVFGYGDIADTGSDYLCMPVVGVFEGLGYILDVVYTDEPMEKGEILCADALYRAGADQALFEANGGGRSFARNVDRLLWERHKTRRIAVSTFYQRTNKTARILAGAADVMNTLLFPVDWAMRFPAYQRAMASFLRQGVNRHDDAPDATTGCAEILFKRNKRIRDEIWIRGI